MRSRCYELQGGIKSRLCLCSGAISWRSVLGGKVILRPRLYGRS